MPLFDVFRTPVHIDELFGEFRRKGGYWRGRMKLGRHRDVPLLVTGSRAEPDAVALALAHELPSRYPAQQPAIAEALLEHSRPYQGAIDAGEIDAEPGTDTHMASPADVWPYVAPVHVLVGPLDGRMTIEIAYSVAWDIEHTLGARLVDWHLDELNGSVRRLAR